jgi:hypothetical protein
MHLDADVRFYDAVLAVPPDDFPAHFHYLCRRHGSGHVCMILIFFNLNLAYDGDKVWVARQ